MGRIRELVASGDVYNSGYGLFTSEQARKDWNNARKKLSRAKVKKTVVVDPDLIWSLPDGEILDLPLYFQTPVIT